MSEFTSLLRDGGPWMWALFGATLLAIGVPVGLARRPPPQAAPWWVPSIVVALIGALGSMMGLAQGVAVLLLVEPAVRGAIGHAALSEGLVPLSIGLGLTAFSLAFAGVMAVRASRRGGDPGARADARFAGAVALALSLPALALSRELWMVRSFHEVLLRASHANSAALWAAGAGNHPQALIAALVAGGLLGIALLAPQVKHLRLPIALFGLFLATVLAMPAAFVTARCLTFARALGEQLPEPLVPRLLTVAPDLPVAGGEVPEPPDSLIQPVLAWRGGQWFAPGGGPPVEPGDHSTLAVPAATRVQGVLAPGRPFHLAMRAGDWVGTLPFDADPADGAAAILLEPAGEGVSLRCPDCPADSFGGPEAVHAALRALTPVESDVEALWIVVAPSWTIQDLAALCAAANHAKPVRCGLR